MVLAFFSANLTSTLAVKEASSEINNFQDVYDRGLNLYILGNFTVQITTLFTTASI